MFFAVQPKYFEVFDDHLAEVFSDINEAKDAAFNWSTEEHGMPMIIWRLTQGNPIKWMEVFA